MAMIADIMSKSLAVLAGDARVDDLAVALSSDAVPSYFVISISDTSFSLVDAATARAVVQQMGDKLGRALLELPLLSIPEFSRPCRAVSLEESEQVARSVAARSPGKQVLIVGDAGPVGIVTVTVRGAMFGAIPTALYGERFDVFEKGTVSPGELLTCPHCSADFEFYKPVISEAGILYCCPACQETVEG